MMHFCYLSVFVLFISVWLPTNGQPPDTLEAQPCICKPTRPPICASDKRTYMGWCFFKCAQRVNPGLKLKHYGPCWYNLAAVEEPAPVPAADYEE